MTAVVEVRSATKKIKRIFTVANDQVAVLTFKDGDLVTVQFRIQENKADD